MSTCFTYNFVKDERPKNTLTGRYVRLFPFRDLTTIDKAVDTKSVFFCIPPERDSNNHRHSYTIIAVIVVGCLLSLAIRKVPVGLLADDGARRLRAKTSL